MRDWRTGYICSAVQTPELMREVWLRVHACRPRKAIFNGMFFDYITLSPMYCSVGEGVYWKYVKQKPWKIIGDQ